MACRVPLTSACLTRQLCGISVVDAQHGNRDINTVHVVQDELHSNQALMCFIAPAQMFAGVGLWTPKTATET